MEIEEVIKERIKENKDLFTEKELTLVKNNSFLIKKIYLIGTFDAFYLKDKI